MAETKGKIIKKSVNVPSESEYAGEARSSVIEGEVYEASQVAKDIVQKAQQQSEDLVAKAREEASGILHQANEERERLITESRDSGYQEGLAKATELITKSKDYYQRAVESSRDNLKMLAVKIAEKIVGRALELEPETINDIVSQAIRTLRQQKNVTVRCNQEDYETLKKNEHDFLGMMGQSGVIDFVADPKIERGGCVVESELGIIDARLETQLKTLQKLLLTK
jgi:type III secretion protein L